MTAVAAIMSTAVQVVEPQETLRRAALLMAELDVGALPVCSGGRLLGMVTDRDLAVRGTAAGLAPDAACVSDVMSGDTVWCSAEDDSEAVLALMGTAQVRRLPVVDADRRLVGVVALADLALRQASPVDDAVRRISEPTEAGTP